MNESSKNVGISCLNQSKNPLSSVFSRCLLGSALIVNPLISHAAKVTELKPVVVQSDKDKAAISKDASTVKGSTATKSALSLAETPAVVSVAKSDDLEFKGASSLSEATHYMAGITPDSRGGVVSRYDMFTIRGFSSNNNYWNGLSLMYDNWYLYPQLDNSILDRIEILKGPASVLYGNAAPGGLVNMVSKEPSFKSKNEIGVKLGNYNLRELSGDFTGGIGSSDFSYRLIALGRTEDGQAKTTEAERVVLAPSLKWEPSDKTSLTVRALYQNDPKSGSYGSAPSKGSLYSNPLGQLEPDFYDGDTNFEKFNREQRSLGYSLRHEFKNGITFKQNARVMNSKVDYESIYGSGLQADNHTLTRYSIYSYESMDTQTIDNQLSGILETGKVKHHLLVGLDYQNMDAHLNTGYGSAPTLDIFNPNNSQVTHAGIMSSMYSITKREIKAKQVGTYLQDQMKWDNFVVMAGTRYDQYDGSEVANGTKTKVNQNHVSSRLGALYTFDSGIAPFISYSESFEPQSGSGYDGKAFKPTTGQQIELGTKYNSPNKKVSLTASVFDLKKQNITATDPAHTGYKIQSGEAQSKGFEMEANFTPVDRFDVALTYTALDMEYTKGDNKGKTPTWVADKTASLWGQYAFTSGVKLGGGARYVGETYVDAANTGKTPGYTLYDASASYKTKMMDKSVLFNLSVHNLTDERYVSGCYSTSWCWFGKPRTVEAGMKVEL
ncbi:TonB-dependent siderophore receptor [Hydrogenovibrio sp. JE_KL2]|uniref:TonB-dependent siderophore receptor n=1 Tax=Hydrogenovibrio sp. JE_KL2 TaxID=2651188 RepID=UPI00128E446C|nr:TonB-dependent siderophore receptor [Hydrogenovibrio sp. JE_KL2]MPQ77477.1 TonB-dependent siderophore receptor [Hydrogenovibrio sp. JE_KL2]